MSSPDKNQSPSAQQPAARGDLANGSPATTLRHQISSGSNRAGTLENRLFSKRAREIQAEEGLNIPWTPQSGQTRDVGFDSGQHSLSSDNPPTPPTRAELTTGIRRARAGTLPSRLSSNTNTTGIPISGSTPATPHGSTGMQSTDQQLSDISNRLRSGSLGLPNRQVYSSAFGPSIFASAWSSRASGIPSSPAAQSSHLSRDEDQTPIRTLDYLGLVDTPTPPQAAPRDLPLSGQRGTAALPFGDEISQLRQDANRLRSYSVNAKGTYDSAEDEEFDGSRNFNGIMPKMPPARPRARTTANIAQSPPGMNGRFVTSSSKSDTRSSLIDESSRLPSADNAPSIATEDISTGPTRALWLGNIPASTTSSSLIAIFGPYGAIESARVLTHKNCGFVNYETIEAAVQARAILHGKEIFPGAGPVRIGFAKVPTTPTAFATSSPEPLTGGMTSDPGLTVGEMKDDIMSIAYELGAESEVEETRIQQSLKEAMSFQEYETEIPPMPEPTSSRLHDAPKLRELRKKIDGGSCTEEEIERIAVEMLDEIAELSSDYLGNTVIQKLFEYCSEETKDLMLERIAPHMAQIGIHKNGTWAAQKIIDVARTDTQINLIIRSLRPYTPLLFLDQFGNYVLQCCLRFGWPKNDFLFQDMLTKLSDIAPGRFGARAMRACLESHHTIKEQQRILAAAIAIHCVQLAVNTNGALLLTWYLDTCTFVNRHRVLARFLVANIAFFCKHKLASLAILKTINQRQEPDARESIIQSLFFSTNDAVLIDVLSDPQNGPSVIFKILTTPFIEGDLRHKIVSNVRKVLIQMNVTATPGYKRLLDEVGLKTRSSLTSSPQGNAPNRRIPSREQQAHYYSVPTQMGYDRGMVGMDHLGSSSFSNPAQSYAAQQNLQYQALLQQQFRAAAAASGNPQAYYGMQPNLAAFGGGEAFRNANGGVSSPVLNANYNPALAQQLLQAGYPHSDSVDYPPQGHSPYPNGRRPR